MKVALHRHQLMIRSKVAASQAACMYYIKKKIFRKTLKKLPSSRRGCPTRPRERKSVKSVYNQLGRKGFRRAYRMHIETFYSLYKKIKVPLWDICKYNPHCKNRKFPHVHNGPIHPTVRLACSLRLKAGGEPIDIACTYNISRTEVHNSFEQIIDAVNSVAEFKIEYPRDHEEQRKIAQGFKEISQADIDCCAGCIDGMLIWMLKPTQTVCNNSKVDSGKFFCGRKQKFGLNFQAIFDHKKRFRNISILFPGSSSDFMAFEGCNLRYKLEEDGFLAPGLCIFGDNAYVNRFYMCTPYPNVGANSRKDDYNFYHSQVRINIECAFGMLVQRWGILRKALSSKFTIKKLLYWWSVCADYTIFLLILQQNLKYRQYQHQTII